MSLAANIERLPLHPVDQYEAFVAIALNGKPLDEIAQAFGISTRAVEQRLALGALHPEVRTAYRNGVLEPRMCQVFTRIPPDQQLKHLLSGEPMWKVQQEILRATEEGTLSPKSGLAEYVGREAYIEAGGGFIADLFSPPGEEKWTDPGIAGEIANRKLNELRHEVLKDWQFFEKSDEWIANGYVVHEPTLSPEQEEEMRLLDGRLTEIREAVEEEEREDYTDAEALEINTIEDRLSQIEGAWSEDQKATLGVVVDQHYQVHYGCEKRKSSKVMPDAVGSEPPVKVLSSALMMELDAHLTRAVHGALVDGPGKAIRLLTLAFLSDYFLFEKLPNLYSGIGIRADFSGKMLPAYDYGLRGGRGDRQGIGPSQGEKFRRQDEGDGQDERRRDPHHPGFHRRPLADDPAP